MTASLFHDIGYIAEKLNLICNDVSGKYFANLSGLKCNNFNLKYKFSDQMFSKYLNYMDKVFTINEFQYYRKTGDKEIMPIIKKEINELEHGTVSSYLFWHTIIQDIKNIQPRPIEALTILTLDRMKKLMNLTGKDIDETFKYGYDFAMSNAKKEDMKLHKKYIQEIEEDIDVAAYAIAIHNIKKYPKVNFDTHPIAFLLILCDELQQWGRPKKINEEYNTEPNEFLWCRVYLMDEDKNKLCSDINSLNNLKQYSAMCENKLSTKDNEIIVNELSSDVIVIKYGKLDEYFLGKFVTNLINIFETRLKNGPSLIAINDNKIFYIANCNNENNYKSYYKNIGKKRR